MPYDFGVSNFILSLIILSFQHYTTLNLIQMSDLCDFSFHFPKIKHMLNFLIQFQVLGYELDETCHLELKIESILTVEEMDYPHSVKNLIPFHPLDCLELL